MNQPYITLLVMTSADGFIARYPGHPSHEWGSAEEQEIFLNHVDAADWSVMGRGTHEAADKPNRRRIVFSTAGETGQWRRPPQLWIDPADHTPADLVAKVTPVHPCETLLILGGTRVHDWFLARGAIDEVHLTIEPVRFGAGLPVFTTQTATDPVDVMTDAGFRVTSRRDLNAAGTRFVTFARS